MKVLYVNKAAIVTAYRDRLRAMAALVDLSVVMPRQWARQTAGRIEADSPRIHQLDIWMDGHNHFHVYRGIDRVIRDANPDLVHIDEEPYSAATTQVVRICARAGIPAVFFSWQNLHKRYPPPFEFMRAYVFRHAAGAIAGTDSAAAVLRRAGYGGPLSVVPQHGINPTRYAPDPAASARLRGELGLSGTSFLIGFCGRLLREKGVDLILEALTSLPTAELAIIGDGPERDALERLAQNRGVASRTRFVGSVDSLEVPRMLAGLDVLVLPSRRTRGWAEQFGRVLTEAMACGVTVVGARSGDIPSVIGDAGLLFDENDLSGLVAALGRLASDPAERAQLGSAGRRRVEELYTNALIAQRTVEFYETISAGSLALQPSPWA